MFRDGAPLMTPGGRPYAVPTVVLAKALQAEWEAATERPDPASMPMTRLAATAIDKIADRTGEMVDTLTAFAHGDTLCYRAETPPALVLRQQEVWQPLLDWCALEFDALLRSGTGIMPVTQSPEALQAIKNLLSKADAFRLIGLSSVAETTGSIVLALALAEGARTSEDVMEAAELDGAFQSTAWGDDPVLGARRASVRKDIEEAGRWFGLLVG